MTETQRPGHDRVGDAGMDRLVMPEWMREQAARAEAEHATTTTTTTTDGTAAVLSPDDPVVVAERIGRLRAEHGPSRTEETVTRADAVKRLTARGFDRDRAQAMVAKYLHEASRAVGAAAYAWGLDQADVDAITADHHIGGAEAERREQLARWHEDDYAEHNTADANGQTRSALDGDAAGPLWVCDDAPGLP